ncbi:MAG: acetyl-CoA carboxylase biotin carboxylase subunit [Chloroflexi bacterium]|nr:acetyl-CoA carboxylase biotin carboxylase subunit [Chloroflexota bacterium]
MFKKILVANRGEIALRVMRTCRELGIATVAVYSDVDRNALHVRYADEAYLLGPGPPRESYLNAKRLIEVARKAKADAVHPGYGFLSENAEFAEACRKARKVFIGPTPEAMRLLGDKVAARRLMRAAGVPVVPGTDGEVEPGEAARVAAKIGYPVLIKAVAGGGGKGIRLVSEAVELESAVRVASSEAASAFGHGGVYVEKYLSPVRHVEVQVMADEHGHAVALGERECSIQRRHQKLVEESPSVAVDETLRRQMWEAAAAGAKAAGYCNAGTVEFLLDQSGQFYFLEVNARLQVEHPVTELCTGRDLVADQIRVAAGEPLPYSQEDVRPTGHAIECRIAAEDPYNGFLPSLGRVDWVEEPSGPGVRVDSSLYSGVEIPYHYDPMLAKVICWAPTRDAAVQRMLRALREYVVVGIQTNIPFHLQLLTDKRFLAGQFSTGFLGHEFSMDSPDGHPDERAALLVAAVLAHQKKRRPLAIEAPPAGGSAWRAAGRDRALGARRLSERRGWQRTS